MFLQSVAWTTMLAENLHTNSVKEAFAHTFDGKHPCCLCRAIAKEKQSEKKNDLQLESRKLDFSHIASEFVFCPPSLFYEIPGANETASLLAHAPALPPPKELLG
jgi:hypothetical protein